MKALYIIGAGSVGGHLAMNLEAYDASYQMAGFLDDDPNKIGTTFCGYPVLAPVSKLLEMENAAVVIGIAFPRIKEKVYHLLAPNKTLLFPTFVSPSAWISKGVKIGDGSIIYPGCSINYGTEVGDFVVMNMNCAIGHDCRLGDFSSYAPGVNLGGHTKIGRAVDIGIGATTRQFVQVGDEAVVGGQCMVIRDVPDGQTIVGVPGKALD